MSDADMDEISYWIHTKRAPCLMNYDNPIKRSNIHSTKELHSVTEETRSPKKKKKRKLSLLDDDSVSMDHQKNIYFESSHKHPRPKIQCKSSLASDVDFNIKKTPVQEKQKKAKLLKGNRTLIKKNKVVTSTPKTTVNLRRSLRHNKGVNHHLNSSFEIFKSSVTNGAHVTNNVSIEKQTNNLEHTEPIAGGDQTVDNKNNSNLRNKTKNQTQNGQYDDMSDVSGFTANYIRSTKVQSNKTPRKLRCKTNRNLVKESQQNESNTVACVNKSANTGLPNHVLNCSTDSSQNLIHLVTTKTNNKSTKVDKSTSLLKFMDSKVQDDPGKVTRRSKALNISFQSQSSATSRYPKRNKTTPAASNVAQATRSQDKRTKNTKNCIEFNNSDKKENPEDKLVSKTRSGRNIGLSVLQQENSVLVVSNSTEPVSSMVSMNVASPSQRKKRTPARPSRNKKTNKPVQSPQRDSLRDMSGFAACFSESDDDSEPLQRKYFCT